MDCRKLVSFLMDYLDGELAPADEASFDEHLSECPDCVAYLQSYCKTVAAGKASFADLADHTVAMPEELVQTILALRK